MSLNYFNLNFSTSSKSSVFALPTTNHYQTVSSLEVSEPSQLVSLENKNQVILFSEMGPHFFRFVHQPKKIHLTIQTEGIFVEKKKNVLKSDAFISSNDPKIIALSNSWVKKANADTAEKIVTTFYQKILEYLEYANPYQGLYTYKQAVDTQQTDCGGFATLLASLLQVQGITSRLVVGYVYSQKKSSTVKRFVHIPLSFSDISMHAWLEVKTKSGGWFPLDPSIEWKRIHKQSMRKGGFGIIPDDRLVLSFGHNIIFEHQNHKKVFPILQHLEELK